MLALSKFGATPLKNQSSTYEDCTEQRNTHWIKTVAFFIFVLLFSPLIQQFLNLKPWKFHLSFVIASKSSLHYSIASIQSQKWWSILIQFKQTSYCEWSTILIICYWNILEFSLFHYIYVLLFSFSFCFIEWNHRIMWNG